MQGKQFEMLQKIQSWLRLQTIIRSVRLGLCAGKTTAVSWRGTKGGPIRPAWESCTRPLWPRWTGLLICVCNNNHKKAIIYSVATTCQALYQVFYTWCLINHHSDLWN